MKHKGKERGWGPLGLLGYQIGKLRSLAELQSLPPTLVPFLKNGKGLYGKKTIDFVTRTEAKDASRLSGGELFVT